MIGILGGMGPLATVDLMSKLIALSGAENDQDNLPVVVWSDPRVPDRRAALLEAGAPSPLPVMLQGIAALEAAGATLIIIACNTAHAWYETMAETAKVPILHIADSACDQLCSSLPEGSRVAVIATHATLVTGFYQERLERRGMKSLVLDDEDTHTHVQSVIACIKRGDIAASYRDMTAVLDKLLAKGADAALLACTELPLAAPPEGHVLPLFDATEALARAAIDYFRDISTCPALPTGLAVQSVMQERLLPR